MNPDAAQTIASFLLKSLEGEQPITRKMLAALPESKRNWRPYHEKCWNAAELAWHIATSEIWFLAGIAAGKFEFDAEKQPKQPATLSEIVAWYDKHFAASLAKVRALAPANLAKTVDFFGMNLPNAAYLNFAQVHSVHHRGQLSTYLRAMGEKVPSIYGGSADEPFQAAQTAS